MNHTPKQFLWGASTSSYQVEGGNSNTDWWKWEEQGKTTDKSGKACDYWNRYKSDHDLLSDLGVNAFRMSLEWARIEPEEGVFSDEALKHYREMLEDLHSRNIKPVVTLWHWTSPQWFSDNYGFHHNKSSDVFARYVAKVAQELGNLIDFYVVINEPMMPLGFGYLNGVFPPGKKNPFLFWKASNNVAKAYKKAYAIIHRSNENAKVGVTHLHNWYEPASNSFLEKLATTIASYYRYDFFANKIKGLQDYIGVDYYNVGRIHVSWKKGIYIDVDPHNPMGWVSYPIGFYQTLRSLSKKNPDIPIYVLENGKPDHNVIDDNDRIEFLKEHMFQLQRALKEGVDVRGYFHWSLLDNYEWHGGFQFRFGLVQVDYDDGLKRTPRKSFEVYKDIISKNGTVDVEEGVML